MTTSWHTYPSIFALGHRYVADLLLDPVTVEEKIDGSQFSFGLFEEEEGFKQLRARSKGAQLNIIAPDGMFQQAVATIKEIAEDLHLGWTYRAEYLMKPKHNVLVYDRVPQRNLIIFDINIGHEEYLPYEQKVEEAERLGLEVVPLLYRGIVHDIQHFRGFLDTVSCLGGQKVEGVVVKNYARFGQDKKVLMGKFVSEAFKEIHSKDWKAANPTKQDVVHALITSLKTDARWHKAVQHLRERGIITDSPRDIGELMKEVPNDVAKEETEYIKQKLFDWAWPHIRRGITGGLPEWYKERLLEKQFDGGNIETEVQPRSI